MTRGQFSDGWPAAGLGGTGGAGDGAEAGPAAGAADGATDGATRTLVEVAPGVHVATAERWATTTVLIVDAAGACLVVDPALTASELSALTTTVARRSWRVTGGVSTHPHWDHLLWSTELGDVPRWATGAAVQHVTGRRAALIDEAAEEDVGADLGLIGRVEALVTDRVPGIEREVIVVPCPGHAPGAAALVLPDAGVLIAPDMLSDREPPLLDLDAIDPVADYRRGLEVLEDLSRQHGIRRLVPGHGSVADTAQIDARLAADRAYLDGLAHWLDAGGAGSGSAGVLPGDPAGRLDDPRHAQEHAAQVQALRRSSGRG